jgi:hypothetical protein
MMLALFPLVLLGVLWGLAAPWIHGRHSDRLTRPNRDLEGS